MSQEPISTCCLKYFLLQPSRLDNKRDKDARSPDKAEIEGAGRPPSQASSRQTKSSHRFGSCARCIRSWPKVEQTAFQLIRGALDHRVKFANLKLTNRTGCYSCILLSLLWRRSAIEDSAWTRSTIMPTQPCAIQTVPSDRRTISPTIASQSSIVANHVQPSNQAYVCGHAHG